MKPNLIRASYGTAVRLGLIRGLVNVHPTAAYFLAFFPGRCSASCTFCAQSSSSKTPIHKLARVTWPTFDFSLVLRRLKYNQTVFRRLCVQSLNYPGFFDDLISIIAGVKDVCSTPISVSAQPLKKGQVTELREIGVERLSIPLDGASPRIFEKVKGRMVNGPYQWDEQLDALINAVKVFGEGFVTTHLIVGLGESDREAVDLMFKMNDIGVLTSLFAFTPLKGTALEDRPPPSLTRYRLLQAVNYLIYEKELNDESLEFDGEGGIKRIYVSRRGLSILSSGEPFRTYGCPGCNRPFYNENVSGPIYNYPRPLSVEEAREATNHLTQYIQLKARL
ncbi:MAG: radical SAM protein [Candidatus Bathyarchaeia archaeon]